MERSWGCDQKRLLQITVEVVEGDGESRRRKKEDELNKTSFIEFLIC
jgi:hypothetical protein